MLRQEFKKMLLEEDGATVVFMPMMVILFMLNIPFVGSYVFPNRIVT